MATRSRTSKANLKTCIKPIITLLDNVLKHYDHKVICGLRGRADQDKAFKNNVSKVQYPNSKHNGVAPNFDLSYAVDISPYPIPKGWGDINGTTKSEISLSWKERLKFYQLAAVVKYEWALMQSKDNSLNKFTLRFGGDWDSDGDYGDNMFDDLVHYELVEAASKSDEDVAEDVAEGPGDE